jgi:hypothetical protein
MLLPKLKHRQKKNLLIVLQQNLLLKETQNNLLRLNLQTAI